MVKNTIVATVLALALAGATAANAQTPMPAKVADTAKGKALVDAKVMTLYVFDRDTTGKSACNGPCARSWLPLAALASAQASADWTVVTRDDGSKQWAYKSKPLHTWAKDTKPGDVTGDGVNSVWHIAQP